MGRDRPSAPSSLDGMAKGISGRDGWEDVSKAVAGAQGCRAEESISYDSLGSSALPPTAWDHNNLLSLTQFARLLYKMRNAPLNLNYRSTLDLFLA